tara:strand:+ start:256 stop:1569 length:1314 start_codon:yes stop_codon:yes gene_type:complete
MLFTLKSRLYGKYKTTIYAIVPLIVLISILFAIKFSDTSNLRKGEALKNIISNNSFIGFQKYIFKKINSPYVNISHEVKSGQTLNNILENYNIERKEITKISNKIKNLININKVKSGIVIDFVVKKNNLNKFNIEQLNIPVSKSTNIAVVRDSNSNFIAKKIITQVYKKIILAENEIKNSLYSSAVESGVEANIIVEFARIFGFEIDFQRDIRKKDTFQIMYETFVDEDGEWQSNGNIIYAYMSVQKREIALYRFGNNKFSGYFDIHGKSIQKALMKTPINGARLSSSFGLRKHPILGFTRMHRGTDFAAPIGTPVMASGTGTVTLAKWCGGGGNCIKIKHNSTYSTVYAHLSKFAKNIKPGKKVKQGQIIGYVGSTGLSTGPHLHYEVIVNGKKVNSQKLKLPSGKILKGAERENFEITRIKTDILLAEKVSKKNN